MSDHRVRQFVNEATTKYLHWDKLRVYPLPAGLGAQEALALIQNLLAEKKQDADSF